MNETKEVKDISIEMVKLAFDKLKINPKEGKAEDLPKILILKDIVRLIAAQQAYGIDVKDILQVIEVIVDMLKLSIDRAVQIVKEQNASNN